MARGAGAVFFVPSALASAELGAAIPEEGGAYAWVRTAFGRFAGATHLDPVLGRDPDVARRLGHRRRDRGGRALPRRPGLGGRRTRSGSVFVLAATLFAVIPLRYGKWVPTTGAIGQIVLLLVFTGSVVVYGAQHGVHGIAQGASLRPRDVHRDRARPPLLVHRRRVAVDRRGGDGRPAARHPRRDRPRRRSARRSCTRSRSSPCCSCCRPGSHLAARPDRRDGDRVHRLRRIRGPGRRARR